MTDKELSIYSKLYDITENNLDGTGVEMETCREAFMKVLQVRPEQTDLSMTYDVPRDKYVQVMYSIVLKRLITPEETDNWKARRFASEREYKDEVMKSVISFTERSKKKTVISNYADSSEETSYSVGKIKKKLRKIAGKIKAMIPLKIKVKLKRMYLRIVNRG